MLICLIFLCKVAATISVPPVLALYLNTIPRPTPCITAPNTDESKRSSGATGIVGITASATDSIIVDISVFLINFQPSTGIPTKNIGMLSAVLLTHRGIPVKYFITIAAPDTPPVTKLAGSNKFFAANATNTVPNMIITYSFIVSLNFSLILTYILP